MSMHIGLSREDDDPPEVGEGEVDTGADKEQVRLCHCTAKPSGWPCQPHQLANPLSCAGLCDYKVHGVEDWTSKISL